METIGLDFEFFDSQQRTMKIVAAVLHFEHGSAKFNLLAEEDVIKFKDIMNNILIKGDILLAYSAGAETRALLSLGINPLLYKWIDLYVEFIMLCNSNNFYCYGNYLDKESVIRFSIPQDPTLSEEEKERDMEDHSETPKNLVNAVYKLLRVKLDVEEKVEMRDLILSRNFEHISARIEEILDYCESDTKYLRALDVAIGRALEKEGVEDFRNDQLERGRYSVCMGICEHNGIPINIELLNNIISKTPEILELHKDEVNSFFTFFIPETTKPPKTYKSGKVFYYKPVPAHKDMSSYQKYVETLEIKNFPKTKTGKYKSDKDTLEEWGYWKGLESLWKYNKIESSLKWFNKGNKDGFFDRYGDDDCVRPYYGIFGTQTGRNAAKAKTFPLAMSSWLRCIIRPPIGSCIIGSDFSQQEVYVAAILSKDKNLLDAYNSGDVYLAFAKQAGLVPITATKQTHKMERTLCKSTVLGLQFGMGHTKLKIKLKLDSGLEVSDEKTQELIDAHKNTFSTYWEWVKDLTKHYKQGNPLSTNDGWILWCDNPVITSVRNFPVQANAASITRRVVILATELGLNVMCSLHDAIYIISNDSETDQELLESCMLKATKQILKETSTSIRVDTKKIEHNEIWIDEKGEKDINKLGPYLNIEDKKYKVA